MFFLPIQASRQLISIKKKNKMFIFYESAPNRQFPFGMPSGFVRDFTNDWQLTSGHSLKDNSEFTIIGLPHI